MDWIQTAVVFGVMLAVVTFSIVVGGSLEKAIWRREMARIADNTKEPDHAA